MVKKRLEPGWVRISDLTRALREAVRSGARSDSPIALNQLARGVIYVELPDGDSADFLEKRIEVEDEGCACTKGCSSTADHRGHFRCVARGK